MQNLKEGAEIVEDRMTFIQDFLQKKYGFGILIFVIIIAGICTAIVFYKEGVKNGKENSREEIISINQAVQYYAVQIKKYRSDADELQAELDSCNKKSNTTNLEELVNKKLEEADRLKRILERKLTTSEKLNDNLKNVLK
ncbi:hypothetical protein FNJ88_11195 [Chryseobacterium sp. SNU WT5]|uniref:hypothetical protein n=1 Tax=Chryseobacterium sp. SNU WT5 TaxID=2594269 RepID=UPI00117FB584|nr:hypothetical protein [Chryseobacterium sp. SNU WT5]QDP86085.1 hypothetical protein FNJ88_11195 [Chryseobacterium sp. SNU WT5]